MKNLVLLFFAVILVVSGCSTIDTIFVKKRIGGDVSQQELEKLRADCHNETLKEVGTESQQAVKNDGITKGSIAGGSAGLVAGLFTGNPVLGLMFFNVGVIGGAAYNEEYERNISYVERYNPVFVGCLATKGYKIMKWETKWE